MIKTINTNEITDEMLYAGVYAAERCSDAGITDLKDVIYDAIFAALKAAPAVEPAQSELLEVVIAMRDWIDAVPHDLQLPTMPGFDRDWADAVIADAQKGKQAQSAAEPIGRVLHWKGEPGLAPKTCIRGYGEYPKGYAQLGPWEEGELVYTHPPSVPPAIVEPARSAAEPVASSFAQHMRFITNDELTEFQERNRARLEKSRLIDSPPTVPPAIVEQIKAIKICTAWKDLVRLDDVLKILEAGNE
jgi:hypothetical protein